MSCVAFFVLPGVVRPYGTILNKVCFNKKQYRQITSKVFLSPKIKPKPLLETLIRELRVSIMTVHKMAISDRPGVTMHPAQPDQ